MLKSRNKISLLDPHQKDKNLKNLQKFLDRHSTTKQLETALKIGIGLWVTKS